MEQEAVQDFLYRTFGYEKIDYFVRGKKDKNISLKNYLENTILGTFGLRSSPSRDIVVENEIRPAWTKKYIIVPHIFPALDLEKQVRNGKDYLDNLYGQDILRPKIQKRNFFLSSFTAFVGYTSNNVREFMKKIHKDFPGADYQFANKGRFRSHIEQDDFYLFTEGSTNRSGAKLIVVSFNAPEDVVKNLNGIAARYYYLMKNMHARASGEDKITS